MTDTILLCCQGDLVLSVQDLAGRIREATWALELTLAPVHRDRYRRFPTFTLYSSLQLPIGRRFQAALEVTE